MTPSSAVIVVGGQEFKGEKEDPATFKFPPIPCDKKLLPKRRSPLRLTTLRASTLKVRNQ